MFVRDATPDDALAVRRILDGAMLETGDVESRIGADAVLVAGDARGGSGGAGGERLLGALVLEDADPGSRVAAVAVRRRHRGRGLGRALVECALEREGRLVARFDPDVRPFYESLGFEVEAIEDDRRRGVAVAPDGG